MQDKLDASFHSNVADDDGEFGETWNVLHGKAGCSEFDEIKYQQSGLEEILLVNANCGQRGNPLPLQF